MSTTNGNLNNLKVTDPQGNVYVLVPVDTEARQTIEEAKELSFDEDYFTVEETDTTVRFGLNGVPIGVDDTTPLKIIQDDQEGFVLGADTLFTSSLIGSTFTDFSSASTYEVDQKVVHDSKLYNCTTAVSVAGVWNDANWTEIPLIDLANQYTLSAIQDLATKEYVDSLVVSSVSAAATIAYVSANYVNNTVFNAYSIDVANQLAALSADKLDKSYSATVNSLLEDKLDISAFNAYSANVDEILNTVDDKLDKTDFNSYSADIDSQLDNKLDTSDFNTYSADVDSQLSDKLDKTDFNTYSATIDEQFDDKLDTSDFDTYSADIDSQLDDKLDKTQFDAYSADVDSQLDDKLDTSDFDTYSADIANQFDTKLDKTQFDSYSADIDSRLSDKLDTSDFNTYSADVDERFDDKLDKTEFDTYSADVDSQLDNKLDKTDFDTYSAVINTQLSDKLDKSEFDSYSADIDSQLDDKLDTSDFNTYSANIDGQLDSKLDKTDFDTYSATVDERFNDKLDVSAVSAFDVVEYSGSDNISVQDHIISIQHSKNLIGDGTSITVIETDAAFVVSATKDFADKTYVTSAVSGKLDTTQFNSYSADVANQFVAKLDKTDFDTYSADINSQLSDKLNTSDFNAYSADVNSQLSDKLDKSEFDTYSADVNSQLSDKLDKTDFNAYSADIDSRFDTKLDVSAVSSFDVEAYSGSENVSVQDHIISLQNTKNLIGDGTSIAVVETDSAFIVSATKDFADKTYVTSAVSSKLDKTQFNSYSATIANQFTTKLDTSDFDTYSAAIDSQLDDKLDASAVSSFDVESYSGSDNISVQDHVISIQHSKNLIGDGTSIAVVETASAVVVSATKDFADKTYVDTAIASVDVTSAISAKIDGIASPASLGGYAAPTKIMVVSAMPATADIDPTTIYFVVGTMTGN